MGCNTCKNKKKETTVEYKEVDSTKNESKKGIGNNITNTLVNGDSLSFIMKSVIFIIILFAFPLIYIGVMIMLLKQLFFGEKGKHSNPIQSTINWFVYKYADVKSRRMQRKREKEFEKNRSYEGDSELLDIEVFETPENNIDVDES